MMWLSGPSASALLASTIVVFSTQNARGANVTLIEVMKAGESSTDCSEPPCKYAAFRIPGLVVMQHNGSEVMMAFAEGRKVSTLLHQTAVFQYDCTQLKSLMHHDCMHDHCHPHSIWQFIDSPLKRTPIWLLISLYCLTRRGRSSNYKGGCTYGMRESCSCAWESNPRGIENGRVLCSLFTCACLFEHPLFSTRLISWMLLRFG